MYNNNGRPLTRRQTIRILVLLTLLAWATQTLFNQWGFGQELPEPKFLPSMNIRGATVELRAEAAIQGTDVKLRQIVRWAEADETTLSPIADLVVLRLSQKTPYKSITLEELRGLLSDAGVNLAAIRLSGATRCTVSRTDVRFNEGEALTKWLDARSPATQPTAATATPIQTPPTVAVAPAPTDRQTHPEPIRTLRSLLTDDLATRLSLPADTLQLTFNPKDDRVLDLAEGVFKFGLEPIRAKDLGSLVYDVTITNNGNSQKITITGTARAWQQQLVAVKPVAFKQVIREQDVQTRRTLIDRLGNDTLVSSAQVIGQQAARELKPGTIVTAKLIEAVPLVRTGQLVTISYLQGSVELRSVARAMEGGAFGQTIRAKNETTGAMFEVLLTGPQTATMGPAPEVEEVSTARNR